MGGIESEQGINIAIGGGSCTGKTTLAASLSSHLGMQGEDYDSIGEQYRRFKGEFGQFSDPVDRCFMWMMQEREELRTRKNGFITDTPLFQLYVSAKMYEQTKRDKMVVRELWERSIEATERYGLIVVAQNPREFPYRTSRVRVGREESSTRCHLLVRTFVEHNFPEKLVLVTGGPEERVEQVMVRLGEYRDSQDAFPPATSLIE